jgi:hypothetical protein
MTKETAMDSQDQMQPGESADEIGHDEEQQFADRLVWDTLFTATLLVAMIAAVVIVALPQ